MDILLLIFRSRVLQFGYNWVTVLRFHISRTRPA